MNWTNEWKIHIQRKGTHSHFLSASFCNKRFLCFLAVAANSQSNEVKTIEVPLGGTINISCEISASAYVVTWYKEGQNKNLCKIDKDDNNLKREQKSTSYFSNLIINNAQRNASGTYTCVVNWNYSILLMHRTRVIITGENSSSSITHSVTSGQLYFLSPSYCTEFLWRKLSSLKCTTHSLDSLHSPVVAACPATQTSPEMLCAEVLRPCATNSKLIAPGFETHYWVRYIP